MKNELIGKYCTFKIVGRKYPITGVLLAFTDEWFYLRNCVDYSLDGYMILKNEKVEFNSGEDEKMANKILKLKKYSYRKEPKMVLSSLDEILENIDKMYGILQLERRNGGSFDVVKYLGKENKRYVFDELTNNAKWRFELKLTEKECHFIGFDNNYLNSLKLVTKFKKIKTEE